MALVIGTNCGFVTSAPTDNPEGSTFEICNNAVVSKFTSPAGVTKIIEIGWWCNEATEEVNFEVGLYSADGTVVPGEAGTRLYVSDTNAKGTGSGWKRVTVDWSITESTDYWIGLQLDNTASATNTDNATSGGEGYDRIYVQTGLPNPFGGGAISDADGMLAIYALYETGGVIPQAYYYMN